MQDPLLAYTLPVIQARSVTRSFPDRGEVLRGVDLSVGEGEFVTLVGRSGSGKTTLLNIIGGLDSGYEGTVEIDSTDLQTLGDRALSILRGSTVGFVFQAYHILDHLTVAENAALPSLFQPTVNAMSRDALNERVDQVLSAVGMAWRAAERPATLSGGERQRVAIARALLLRPRVLLCDEPTGNLDPHTGHEVVDLLRGIHEDEGVTVVVATHDEVISRSADRVLELRRGRLDDWGGPVRAEP